MTLTLFIKSVEIDSLEINLTGIRGFEQRKNRIHEYTNYLRGLNWKDVMLATDWEIILTATSKLNEMNYITILSL